MRLVRMRTRVVTDEQESDAQEIRDNSSITALEWGGDRFTAITWSKLLNSNRLTGGSDLELVDVEIFKTVLLRVPTKAGISYQVQESLGLDQWRNYGAPVTGDGTVKSVCYENLGIPGAFFRVVPSRN